VSWRQPGQPHGMHVFTCDRVRRVAMSLSPRTAYERVACARDFRSASVKAVLADQLHAAGWSIWERPPGAVAGSIIELQEPTKRLKTLGGNKDRMFLCMECTLAISVGARMPDKRA
jgi:uncharacterized protein (DUF2336 family)